MGESDRDHSSEMEARLDENHHRWLRPEEICGILRDPNSFISKKPAITPPSGSIVLYDKKLLKRFRNDGYEWKKAKGGRTKEAHEKLKVEGVDVLHCYYAHREDDKKFQRRSYWMIDNNLSHRVLVHYLDVKEDQTRNGKGGLQYCKTDASAYNHQASSGLPPILGLQPSNFQYSQARDATNLNSTQTLEPETIVSAYNHQASSGLPPVLGLQPSNFQNSQATDEIYFQDFPDFPDFGDLLNKTDSWFNGLFDADCTNARVNSSAAVEPSHSSLGKRQSEVDEEEEGNDTNQAWKRHKVTCGQKAIATSAATNITAAPESRQTSDANQYFVQDVENQEQELEPTSIEPENGKSKAVVQNDFGTGKSHEFAGAEVRCSLEELHELLDRASAPNTLASSSISTPTIDIATIRTTLEMDFTTMAGDVQRTDKISLIKSFVDSNCFPTSSKTSILPILEQLEQSLRAYSEYDKGKNLNARVEDMTKHLQHMVKICGRREEDFQRLEKEKMRIEAELAAIRAEIDNAFKQTEPIQAELNELLPQRDQFKKNEGNLKIKMDIGDGFWTILKKVFPHHLPP